MKMQLILRHSLVLLCAALLDASAFAVEWRNLDEDHYLGGRKCSAGYLQGKVTLVCRDPAMALKMENVWTNFKTKPFVLIGTYPTAPNGVSYPVYGQVALEEKSPATPLYVVDSTSRLRYYGSDEHRATEIIVTLLTDMESPKSEAQWRRFLDYEFACLPAHAYLRYQDFKKAFPVQAKDYADKFSELSKIPNIQRLVELVRFAKGVKDLRAIDPNQARLVKSRLKGKIDDAVPKFTSLKDSPNPFVVQEAKNALADLAWARAAL